jgi:S-adenosylmethionine-dependent methyltransferase
MLSVPRISLASVTRVQTDAGRERAGSGRLGLISRLLGEALTSVSTPGQSVSVLDCGGGSGAFAVPLAAAGCDVTVVDISADALATLRRRADEAGVSQSVHAVNGDVETLGDLLPGRSFDAVLVHGVLDAVDQVDDTFAGLARSVRPGGLLSVLVANPLASVMARALAGEPALALAELRELDSDISRVSPESVIALCERSGLVVEARHGIGVFSDLVPGAALDTPGAREALRALDAEAAARPPFADLAGRIHLLVRRPAV